jgi:hypothetical protein
VPRRSGGTALRRPLLELHRERRARRLGRVMTNDAQGLNSGSPR